MSPASLLPPLPNGIGRAVASIALTRPVERAPLALAFVWFWWGREEEVD